MQHREEEGERSSQLQIIKIHHIWGGDAALGNIWTIMKTVFCSLCEVQCRILSLPAEWEGVFFSLTETRSPVHILAGLSLHIHPVSVLVFSKSSFLQSKKICILRSIGDLNLSLGVNGVW